ncbi:Calx-beta domain-containing protein, partial [Colwellia piezophila]|uniref:Calx-beta domain-containing protein n=1 Tax=Colwellia piezophila TaxID=211668 RepID=UPI000593D31F
MADKIIKDKVNNDKILINEQSNNSDLAVKIADVDDAEVLAEIEAIQAAIEENDTPIEDIETAAGEANDGGSTVFVDVSRDASETLASSDFETATFALDFITNDLKDTNIQSFSSNVTPVTTDSTLTAQFTDNFVSGVTYTTSSGLTGKTGDTGTAGEFKYNAGDTITFTIGDVIIGQFSADAINGDVLFLQDIAGNSLSDSNSSYVENMAIFLQALDDDLSDSSSENGILSTDDLIDNDSSYATNITISQAILDAFTGYIDPTTGEVLDITTSGKEMISQALASVGIEFTRDTEQDESGNGENTFETIAMDHVAQTIDELAGERAPDSADQREVDTIDVPGGLINYHFAEADGVITFTTNDLLVGAVGQQVITANLVVDNVKLSANFESIGTLVDLGDGNFEIQLNEGVTGKALEGLAIDYRVEDWTVSKEVTSQTLDSYKSHLSADIADVKEDVGFNQFTLNSSLTFDSNTQLQINFTSELLSEQLTTQISEELAALGKDAVIENGIIQVAEYADDYTVPLEYSNDGGTTWHAMTVVAIDTTGSIPRPIFGFELAAGNSSLEIRVPIFDDVTIEPTEYFRAEIKGDDFYDETILFAIEDNDSVASDLPTIDIDYVLVTEGQGDAVFTLTLSEASDEVITVNYSTTELSAKFGDDFEETSGTVTFQPGETTATISIVITDDLISEDSPEFALINLSDATNAVINDGQGTLRIFDNDYPIELTVSAPEVTEGEQAVFTVDISKDLGDKSDSLVLVHLSLADGSATDGSDYDASTLKVFYGDASNPQYLESDGNGNYIVPAGVTALSVVVDTIDDGISEASETFTLHANIGENKATGTSSIIDNDALPNAPTVTITTDTDNNEQLTNVELGDSQVVNVVVGIPAGAVAGDTLTISGQTPIVLTQAQIDGKELSFDYERPDDGQSIEVTATLTDGAGNTSATTSKTATVGDTTPTAAPTVTITEDVNDDAFISDTELDGEVNVTISLKDTGAVEGDTLTVNGSDIVLTEADITAGEVLTTVAVPVEGETLTVDATITDVAGNTSVKGTDSAKLDTSAAGAPTVVITEDANNDGFISDAELAGEVNVTISLKDTGAVEGDTLTVNGQGIVLTEADIIAGEILTTVAAPSEGTALIVDATITDIAGNTSAKGTDSAKIDTSATGIPTVSFESPGSDNLYNKAEVGVDGTITATITIPTGTVAGDSLTYQVDGGSVQTVILTADDINNGVTVEVLPGATVTATITDIAGNESDEGTNTAVGSDVDATSAPTVTITTDTDNNEQLSNVELGNRTTVNVVVGIPADAVAGDTLTVSGQAPIVLTQD